MQSSPDYVLVTGATGFIGAHVVDCLLSRGLRVRGATRSLGKGDLMIKARPQFQDKLDFVQVEDFEKNGVFNEAVKGVNGVIHVASPLTYDTTDNEKELILPAINGVRSIMEASATNSSISRVVITSSFASVVDIGRKEPNHFTYTGKDWNPLTYEQAIDPATDSVMAYRGSKKFAELAAWEFISERKPQFDIVTLCPPMTFGPIAHPVKDLGSLNESNATLWDVASGKRPLPVARVPFWIDVRDLATAHVEALLRLEVGGRRYIPAAPERFSYGLVSKIILENDSFDWAKGLVEAESQPVDTSYSVDGEKTGEELGFKYRSFQETVVDFVTEAKDMERRLTGNDR
ncbi:NAD dependent epimerase/dehydratase [Xylariales sp. PMI_506]|nr:NAD dependent epimerase/dehydratase [Xylariales sp. PMI_506]